MSEVDKYSHLYDKTVSSVQFRKFRGFPAAL